MEHDWSAFINRDLTVDPPSAEGSLKKLSFAVKDVFAVEGHANAAGNPDWLRTHEPAEKNAEAVDLLLREGARLKGAAHTDGDVQPRRRKCPLWYTRQSLCHGQNSGRVFKRIGCGGSLWDDRFRSRDRHRGICQNPFFILRNFRVSADARRGVG